ncbi:hypothetical protein B0H11DRAFT_1959584 [Mycena galericulata]|nr:hypothetical protein B0H11DRAFT_1959584 [Mycena galericulata]
MPTYRAQAIFYFTMFLLFLFTFCCFLVVPRMLLKPNRALLVAGLVVNTLGLLGTAVQSSRCWWMHRMQVTAPVPYMHPPPALAASGR